MFKLIVCLFVGLIGGGGMCSCSFHHDYDDEVIRVAAKNPRDKVTEYYYFGSDELYDYFKVNGLKYKIDRSEKIVPDKDRRRFSSYENVEGEKMTLGLDPGRILTLLPTA